MREYVSSLMIDKTAQMLAEKKQSSNILDFSDLEHCALKILQTPAREAYQEYFEEIMTDEYQDSNNVQEAILTSIARIQFQTC